MASDPVTHFIAKSIVEQKGKGGAGPSVVELETAITQIQINSSIKQLPNIVVSLVDARWEMLDSGFFDTDANSLLDTVDVNYPEGSRYWWRLTQVSPRSGFLVTLTFVVREAVYLLGMSGPLSADRAKKTRAEFLAMATQRASEKFGPIEFYSLELHDKQKIVATPIQAQSSPVLPTPSTTGKGSVAAEHPELHPAIAAVVQTVLDRFPLTITSTTSGGHATNSYHYRGEAADIAGPSGLMYQAAQWIAENLSGSLAEGIHNPNLSVKFGVNVPSSYWGSTTWAEHTNHIHLAVED